MIRLAIFGSGTKNARYFETETVYVIANSGQNIPVNVLIVSFIVPLKAYRHEATKLRCLRVLKLVYLVTDNHVFNISILIGADHYWSIVQNKVVRGNGPAAVKSTLCYLLSDPLPVRSAGHTTVNYMLNLITSPPDVHNLERFCKLESLA